MCVSAFSQDTLAGTIRRRDNGDCEPVAQVVLSA